MKFYLSQEEGHHLGLDFLFSFWHSLWKWRGGWFATLEWARGAVGTRDSGHAGQRARGTGHAGSWALGTVGTRDSGHSGTVLRAHIPAPGARKVGAVGGEAGVPRGGHRRARAPPAAAPGGQVPCRCPNAVSIFSPARAGTGGASLGAPAGRSGTGDPLVSYSVKNRLIQVGKEGQNGSQGRSSRAAGRGAAPRPVREDTERAAKAGDRGCASAEFLRPFPNCKGQTQLLAQVTPRPPAFAPVGGLLRSPLPTRLTRRYS